MRLSGRFPHGRTAAHPGSAIGRCKMRHNHKTTVFAVIPAYCMIAIAAIVMLATASVSAGTVWQENGMPVCTVTDYQESPYMVSVGSGETIVVWADTRDFDYDIYAQKLDIDGQPQWTAGGVKICGADYDQQFPSAVSDGTGGAIVVWQDGRLGDDGLDIYAQHIASDGSAAWQVDGVPVCSHEAGLTDPPLAFSQVVAGDGSNGIIVAWRDTRNDPIVANTEIFVQRMDINGSAMWTANGIKILGFGLQKWSTRNPIIAYDGTGGAVIAWQDARSYASTGNDLYAQHVTSAGIPEWADNGIAICSVTGDQGYPDIVDLGGGESAIVWEDKRSGNYDIYIQRLSAAGIPLWGTNGSLVCASANDQRTPRICANGDTLITAWTDKRNSTSYTDIFAQTLNSSGVALWADQGTAICTANGSQTRVRMCSSVSGLTILTWMDTRNETLSTLYDIYAQMIDSTGTAKWEAAGIPVVAITGNTQRMHQAVSDGQGSLCGVWEDDRNSGDWDIYAQKLSPWLAMGDIVASRSQLAGTPVTLPARIVTGSFDGYFYVQESNRIAGIRVEYPLSYVPGTIVSISGTQEFALEPYIKASVVQPTGSTDMPGALGITASRLGSTAIGEVSGLANVGLLVRTWGHVASKPTEDQPYTIITDGACRIRVYCTADVEVDDTVIVTGICSGEQTADGVIATILTRDSSDIQRIITNL